MTFTPIIFGTGLAGWNAFKPTISRQMSVFTQQASVVREVTQFEQRAASYSGSAALMKDYTSLSVALNAFDLSQDIGNYAFVKRLIDEDPGSSDALSNKLSDLRYKEFARNMHSLLSLDPAQSAAPLVDLITRRHEAVSFEKAVGEVAPDFRLALSFERDVQAIIGSTDSNSGQWFKVLASKPVSEVLRTVFRLPAQFAAIDIDRQHSELQERAQRMFGTSDLGELSTGAIQDKLMTQFFAVRQINSAAQLSSQSIALSLLSSIKPLAAER